MNETKVIKCSCTHKYQDKLYGEGNRLHNPLGKPSPFKTYRCTVCGNET